MGVFSEIEIYARIARMCINCPDNTLIGENPHLCEHAHFDADKMKVSCNKDKDCEVTNDE